MCLGEDVLHNSSHRITKIRLFKHIETFTTKNGNFSDKKQSNIFHISAENIDCGYSLEPPQPQSMFLAK